MASMDTRSRRVALSLLLFAAAASTAGADERLRYTWKLDGFVGSLAALFFPSRGVGELSVVALADGTLKSELRISPTSSRSGDFYLSGSEWEPTTGRTVRAWSSQVWRGERKSKQSEVDAVGVVDVVSGILALRRDPPATARRLEIWSDGKLYPVLVVPHGAERRVLGGREVSARHLTVRGLDIAGRKRWKGQLELWIADDPEGTPIEIVVNRGSARVRLTFVERSSEPSALALSGGPP